LIAIAKLRGIRTISLVRRRELIDEHRDKRYVLGIEQFRRKCGRADARVRATRRPYTPDFSTEAARQDPILGR
jgi:hypothetical protein